MTKRIIFGIIFIFLAIVVLITFAFIVWWFASDQIPQSNDSEINSNINTNSIHPSNKASERFSNKKGEKNEKLQRQTDALTPLFGKMQNVPVFIVDEPILKSGTETQKGVAYTSCENKNEPTIFVKRDFYQKNNQKQLVNILKHELVHAWFCQQGTQAGHDERFRRKFTEVGGFGN